MKTKYLLRTAIILGMLFFYQNSNAQCWNVGEGTNGGVYCMYTDSIHNCIYMGGGFQNSGNDTLNHCGYWNDSAYCHMGMPGNYGTDDSVWCMAYFNGDLYVGGSFTYAGGVPANHVARWDGTTWYAVGNGFNKEVHSLCVFNSQLYAGGEFTFSGGTSINYIAYWDGTQWNQVGGGTNDDVEVMCAWSTYLIIGGDFTTAGGITVNNICKWDGTSFSAMGSGFSNEMMMGSMVHSLCVYDGDLYAGGMFSHCGNDEMHNIAMWNGSSWHSIGEIGDGEGSNSVNAMCVYDDQLYLGGYFASCDGNTSNNIGVWNGNNWSTIGTGMNGTVRSFSVYKNYLYIGGAFSNADGTPASNVAKYSSVTGILSMQEQNNFLAVYPNPASEHLYLSWTQNDLSPITIFIYDAVGRQISEWNLGTLGIGQHSQSFDISNWRDDIYFCSINGSLRNGTKFIVTNAK